MSLTQIIEKDSHKEIVDLVYRAPVTYMLRCEDWYKIGHTRSLENRIEVMRTGNPYPIHLVYAIQTEKYKQLEEDLHIFFAGRERYREWFKLLPEDEQRFEDFVKNYLCPQEDQQN